MTPSDTQENNVQAEQQTYDVLVLDAHSRKALATARSLGRRGLRVAMLASVSSLPAPAFSSRWCQKKLVYQAEEGTAAYVAYLDAVLRTLNVKVLLPLSDGTIALIRQHRKRLEKRVRIALADETALSIAVNKGLTLEVAKRLGLDVPRGIIVKKKSEVEMALREIGLPAVVKPIESWLETEEQRYRVTPRLVTTFEEAFRAVEVLTSQGGTILFQQFLSGKQEVISLFCVNGEVYARFAQWSKRSYPPLGGVRTLARSIPYPADIGEQAERLVREISLDGYAMVEFRRDSFGKPYLMEINSRLTAGIDHAIQAGVDFPYLLYQWTIGKQVEVVKNYRTGVWMRYLGGDIATTLAAIKQRGRPGVRPPVQAILAFCASCFVPMRYDYVDWRDPLPLWVAIVGWGRALVQFLCNDEIIDASCFQNMLRDLRGKTPQ